MNDNKLSIMILFLNYGKKCNGNNTTYEEIYHILAPRVREKEKQEKESAIKKKKKEKKSSYYDLFIYVK